MGWCSRFVLGLVAITSVASHEGADARLGWRRVFSVPNEHPPSDATWESFRERCGGAASRRNGTLAAAHFAELVQDRVVHWNGTVYRVGSHEGAPEVLVKMEPSDAFFHDLVLWAPSALEGAVLGVNVGDQIRFEASGVQHGGALGYHTFRVVSLAKLVQDATAREAEEGAGTADAAEDSWEAFRAACGQAARKRNALRAGRSYREQFEGKEVTWSGRVWMGREETPSPPSAPDSEAAEPTVRVQVKMSPSDAWFYDVVVTAPASAVRHAAGDKDGGVDMRTKDYVTFTGTFAPVEGALGTRDDVVINASSVLVLPHEDATAGSHDEL